MSNAFRIERWDDNRYVEEHIKNVLIYINVIEDFLANNDLRNITNKLYYQSFCDAISINIYWIAEAKKVKNIKKTKNVNNPFYIWCKFFDSLKHPDRQKELARKMIDIIERNLVVSRFTFQPRITKISEFVDGLKTNDEQDNISEVEFYKLFIKFVYPEYIDTTSMIEYGINDAYGWSKNNCLLFWKTLKSFFQFLKQHINDDWIEIWSKYEQSEMFAKEIIGVWNACFKLFNLCE